MAPPPCERRPPPPGGAGGHAGPGDRSFRSLHGRKRRAVGPLMAPAFSGKPDWFVVVEQTANLLAPRAYPSGRAPRTGGPSTFNPRSWRMALPRSPRHPPAPRCAVRPADARMCAHAAAKARLRPPCHRRRASALGGWTAPPDRDVRSRRGGLAHSHGRQA
jgi:hypothetical protein